MFHNMSLGQGAALTLSFQYLISLFIITPVNDAVVTLVITRI